jgi:hypothetical protein
VVREHKLGLGRGHRMNPAGQTGKKSVCTDRSEELEGEKCSSLETKICSLGSARFGLRVVIWDFLCEQTY